MASESAQLTSEKHEFAAAWRYPQFRLLFASTFGFYTGKWIETVVGAWLILELTNSPFLVGLLGTCRFAAMLSGPFCGAIADRFNRRQILILAQIVYAISALLIMGLFLTDRLEPWHLFLFTIVGGICATFDYSVRYAVAADIVKSQYLVGAISLLFVSQGSTAILGPLLGGSLLGMIGASGCFALVAGGFLLSFLVLLPMKTAVVPKPTTRESMWQNLVVGFRYIKSDRSLSAMLLIAALANLLVFHYWFTLIAIFARDVLHTGASGYGLLMAAIGLGYTVGPLITAVLPSFTNKGKLLIAATIVWPAVLLIFAVSRIFYFSFALLVFAGIFQGISMALIQSLLLLWSAEEMRGRVSGARAFAVSAAPLGNLLAGAGAGLWGAPITLIASSAIFILLTVLIAIWAFEITKRN